MLYRHQNYGIITKKLVILPNVGEFAVMIPEFGLLLFPGIPSTIVAGLIEFFQMASVNETNPRLKRCRLRTISLQGGPIPLNGGLSIQADIVGRTQERFDLIFIPAIGKSTARLKQRFALEMEWLKSMAATGTRLASICSGAFVLAGTGLLDGKAATTHWRLASKFRRLFPAVRLNIERMVVDSELCLSSGGSNAFYDLALYVAETYLGQEVAQFCAHNLLLDVRSVQTPFTIFAPQKQHGVSIILEAQRYLEQRFRSPVSPEEMASLVGISDRSFFRLFKQATGDTPNVYLQRLRVDAARRELSESDATIEEISYAVGYESVGFFRTVFRRHTGFNPLEYRRRFSRRSLLSAQPAEQQPPFPDDDSDSNQ